MSTVAPTKPAGIPATTTSGYEVGRPHGKCAVCGEQIQPDDKYVAGLRETPAGFERIDCMVDCWDKVDRQAVVAFLRTTMPRPQARKKVVVDDEDLSSLFEGLPDVTGPPEPSILFVLGL